MAANEEITVEQFEDIPDVVHRDRVRPNHLIVIKPRNMTWHKCPCGGHLVMLPIEENGWKMTESEQGVTYTPSILNKPCNTHYFIRNSKFVMA